MKRRHERRKSWQVRSAMVWIPTHADSSVHELGSAALTGGPHRSLRVHLWFCCWRAPWRWWSDPCLCVWRPLEGGVQPHSSAPQPHTGPGPASPPDHKQHRRSAWGHTEDCYFCILYWEKPLGRNVDQSAILSTFVNMEYKDVDHQHSCIPTWHWFMYKQGTQKLVKEKTFSLLL